MRAVGAVAAVELRRFLRDRSNIFFVFIFPLLLVFVLGSQFGGDGTRGRIAVSGEDGALRQALVEQLEEDELAVSVAGDEAVREQVGRGRADVGVFLSPEAARSFDAGHDVRLEVIAAAQQGTPATLQRLRTAADQVMSERGQVAALEAAGVPPAQAVDQLDVAAAAVTGPRLSVVDAGEVAQEFSGVGQFDLGAVGQMLLFVFLASLAGSATLIQARRLGVVARTLAAPVSAVQTISGQALGRFAIAMFQGAYIMLATAILFDVDWGRIWLALLVLATFAAVAAGAAMLVGSVMDNDNAASGIGVGLGLVLAALGGSMLPLELFPDTLRTVAYVTPHAWAYEAYAEVQRHGGTLVDVLPQLAVLVAMAVVLLAIGAAALRRSLTRAL